MSSAQPMGSPLPTTIETSRLLLRPPLLEDAEEVFERYASDPEVTRYLSWKTHTSPDDSLEFLSAGLNTIRAKGGTAWMIALPARGPILGMIGVGVHSGCRADLGYCLARDAWGKGFATEAATAVVEAVLQVPSLWRAQGMCDAEHVASARVLEKTGMRLEGTLRRYFLLPNRSDEPRDMLCYAKVRGD